MGMDQPPQRPRIHETNGSIYRPYPFTSQILKKELYQRLQNLKIKDAVIVSVSLTGGEITYYTTDQPTKLKKAILKIEHGHYPLELAEGLTAPVIPKRQ